ncbi:MAG: transposase zinc-binding domain-containing protein, partial [Aggregatilineales bacterium]
MDESATKTKTWTVKDIVKDGDNWVQYQRAYTGQVSAHQVAEIEKMLACGDPTQGFATYICLNCGETVRVCFSCKSRVCSSCGK